MGSETGMDYTENILQALTFAAIISVYNVAIWLKMFTMD